ncbi:MAG: hypothetical protein JO093_22930 [Acidobacteria bacterium]|nr:hypothetical protein [Acidobacteriota bacterium]MBV9188482.1 hypothetical protein [Acidobacteriota bacterium]
MQVEVTTRRREALMLVLTAVLLGLFVEFSAGVLLHATDQYRDGFRAIVGVSGVIVFLVLAYVVVLSRREKTIYSAQFVFCFDKMQCQFVDIPRCSPSVHARVHFGRLSDSRRAELATFDHFGKFFGSEFEQFVNEAVQAMLLDLLLQENVSDAPKEHLRKFSQFPESLKRNQCFRRESEALPYVQYRVPPDVKVETFGPYDRFIRFSSTYGAISISWELGLGQTAFEVEAIAVSRGRSAEGSVHDLIVDISVTEEFKYIHMHSKRLDGFAAWALRIRRTLSDLDWPRTLQVMPVVLLTEVLRTLKGDRAR